MYGDLMKNNEILYKRKIWISNNTLYITIPKNIDINNKDFIIIYHNKYSTVRKVWIHKTNKQLLATIPLSSELGSGDFVYIKRLIL
jgi:hypothetical protein